MKIQHGEPGGFSALELIVAIAIVALLAGISLPVMSHTREAAKKAECMARLRGLGQAILLYTQENGGRFPRSVHSANAHRERNWAFMAMPYLGLPTDGLRSVPLESFNRFYRCPAHDESRNSVYSYGLNVHFELDPLVDGNSYAGYPSTWRTLPSLPSPARTILLAETADRADHLMSHFWSRASDADASIAVGRHRETHYLFADGHVEAMPIRSTYTPAHSVNLWNPSLAGSGGDVPD